MTALVSLLFLALFLLAIAILYYPSHFRTPKQYPLSKDSGIVLSVSISSNHVFSKIPAQSITLLENLGVEGDCHCGSEVQHLSRRKSKPYPPNLRQVHLIQSELFQEFRYPGSDGKKYTVRPGDLGENITTTGLDLLGLGVGTKLHFINPATNENGGNHAVVRVTGLRNPCFQISRFQSGLQERCLVRNEAREIVERRAGIMSVVEVGGVVMKDARIVVEKPKIYEALACV